MHPSDPQAIAFLSMLHDTNLTQHVNFPTHDPGSHTLDLVITSTDSSLNPAVTRANTQPNDLLATVLLSHGSPNPFVLLVAPVVKPNPPRDPPIPLQTILSSGVFAINITNLSLQPRELTTLPLSNHHQIVLDANGTP